ncbi:MAG: ATP-dependent chaperone ClpB [Candidatus Melainabacteria bacterium 35_41]|nr:MAG: ATP-dependent chaperone ClpB [Candidatus Melainabacteria bacterium 35_41]
MLLTDHVQAIIKSGKSIVVARNYPELAPEHLMLALMLDQNDLPQILMERVGIDSPEIVDRLNCYVSKRAYFARGKFSDIRFSTETIVMMKVAQEEAEKHGDDQVSIEHLFLALFRIDNKTLNHLWQQCGINRLELYEKMTEEVNNIVNLEETVEETSEQKQNDAQPASKSKTIKNDKQEKKNEALSKYTTDLTELAAKNKLDPVIGRDDEIRRTIQILNRRSKNNPVIIGEPGVGKTAIIEGLAQRIISGDVPESLKNDKILALDLGALLAGASYRGEFEERLKSVLKAIEEKSDDLMLFIDEIHTIMGAGSSEGSADAGNLLKPMLARGNIRVIGATTIDEYRKYIEKDKALERRFQPVLADEPSVETTISILRGLKDKYEGYHSVKIKDSAITAAVKLSHRYISDRCLPDKAIDLIDEAASALRIEIDTMPEEIDVFIREKIQLEMNRKALEQDESTECNKKIEKINKKIADLDEKINKLKEQWLKEKKVIDSVAAVKRNIEKLKAQIEMSKKNPEMTETLETKYSLMLDMEKKLNQLQLQSGKKRLLKEEIDEDDIGCIVAKWTGIPVNRLMEDESKKLIGMEKVMHKRVIGQEEAVTKIANAIRLSRSGLRDPKRPIGTFLFLGPTGVGKTELGKTLAEILFNDEDSLIRIDMSEFMEKHNISRLVGSTAGYVGYEEGGQLTEAVRRKPYSVVLFDEVEKAHSDVFNIMLQMFDDGRLTDGQGRLIDFKNTVLIMTSNLASEIILDENLSAEEKQKGLQNALKSKFKPEFLNRIDEIIMFKALTLDELSQIVEIQTGSLKKRLLEQDIELNITESAKEHLANEGYEPLYGARPLRRVIRQLVEIPLSMKILEGEFIKGDKVSVDFNNEMTFSKQ